jgi:type I restriction enzyme M protein
MMTRFIHKLHNDIRDNCALSDSDKPLLVSAILLSLLDSSTIDVIKHTTENIGELILTTIRKIFIQHRVVDVDNTIKYYNFLVTHSSFKNNDMLRKMVMDVYNNVVSQNVDYDVLNEFYTEFVSYNSMDSKTLGIVLTPPYIIRLMTHLANLQPNDVVLDLCTGTGSFVWESLKFVCKVIACEYQDKLFNMLFANNIVRNGTNNILYKGDCFTIDFTQHNCTKSIINPPFGSKTNNRKELDFVSKQLESIQHGGRVVAIFPIGCLSSSQTKLKRKIATQAKIRAIIELNNQVFYPTANIKCCILVLDKVSPHNFANDKVMFVNFENDGYEVEKQRGRLCKNEQALVDIINIIDSQQESSCSYLTTIQIDKDWKYNRSVQHDEKAIWNNVIEDIKTQQINKITQLDVKQDVILSTKFVSFKIVDIFDIKTHNDVIKTCEDGEYPLISSSGFNNGIAKYVSKYTFSGGQLTIAKNGNVGSCFYHPYKFTTTTDVFVLTCKTDIITPIELEKTSQYITNNIKHCLSSRYSWSYKLNAERLSDEHITLPTKNDKLDVEYIIDLLKQTNHAVKHSILQSII